MFFPEKPHYRVHSEAVHSCLAHVIRGRSDWWRIADFMVWQLAWAVSDKHADHKRWQDAPNAFRHAMTPKGWTAAEAKTRANKFIRDNLAESDRQWGLYKAAGRNTAAEWVALSESMNYLGLAVHCMQDAASPAHNRWVKSGGGAEREFITYEGDGAHVEVAGEELTAELAQHVWTEAFWPGEGSHLYKATRLAFQYWREPGTRPTDFFSEYGIDKSPKWSFLGIPNPVNIYKSFPAANDPQTYDDGRPNIKP